jgi:hypothetical protein
VTPGRKQNKGGGGGELHLTSSEKKRGRKQELEEAGFVDLDKWRVENLEEQGGCVDGGGDEGGMKRVDTLAELMGTYGLDLATEEQDEIASGSGVGMQGGVQGPFTDLDGLD